MDGNYSLSDIAAVSGGRNNGMFGGDGDWGAWIILFLLFGMFGRGGWGGFGGDNGWWVIILLLALGGRGFCGFICRSFF